VNRRFFLKNVSATAALTSFSLNGFAMRPFANRRMLNLLEQCDAISERVLVLIQLKGGNDGLNTLIPLDQYSEYAKLRETIKIPDSGPDKYITLDSTLPNTRQTGLHPVLTPLKEMYENGLVTIVQGVGYENINQSHFKGTDIWLSGGDNTKEGYDIHSGWAGRALNAMYPKIKGRPVPEMLYPLGIQVGDPNPSLGFHTETEHQNSINLSGQDPEGFYSLVQTIGGAPLIDVPESQYGVELAYIMGVERAVDEYSEYITQAFKAGNNAFSAYPQSGLAYQLKTIARLIKGGCKTRIYLCSLGGFDTHGRQIAAEGQVILGNHAERLQQLTEAVSTFMKDLKALGLGQQVMACTFSEFGRCARENGSLGTDHGTLAPMFVFGHHAEAGMNGQNVNLRQLSADFQLQGQQFDYRQVFATLLQDWLGAGPYAIEQTLFSAYSKLPLIQPAAVATSDCYKGSVRTSDPSRPAAALLTATPNPAFTHTEVVFRSDTAFEGRLSLHTTDGSVAQQHRVQVQNGINRYYIQLSDLPGGLYFIRLEAPSGQAAVCRVAKN
jgi:uncharacterized protein (DUF1501 family)